MPKPCSRAREVGRAVAAEVGAKEKVVGGSSTCLFRHDTDARTCGLQENNSRAGIGRAHAELSCVAGREVLADGKVVLRVWKQCLRCLQITEGLGNVLQPINCTK